MTRTRQHFIGTLTALCIAAPFARTGGLLAQVDTSGVAQVAQGVRVVLGEPINTRCHEVAPLVSPDGLTLYFHRFAYKDNVGGTAGGEDIWKAVRSASGTWGVPTNMGPPLNTVGNNFVTSVSPDGSLLYLGNVYRPDGSMTGGLSVSHRIGSGWTYPTPVVIEGFKNTSTQSFFSIAPSGRVMVLEVDNTESMGLDDLYVSFRKQDGSWTHPTNLGAPINTPGREITPFLASDGRTLYFSSDGRRGFGDQDVYMSRRLDDTWLEWSEPINLGPRVNTSGWDAYFTVPADGHFAYLVNYVDATTNSDIVRVDLPSEYRPLPMIICKGTTYDVVSGAPVEGTVWFSAFQNGDLRGETSADSADGSYLILVPPGNRYLLHASATGYLALDADLDLHDSSGMAQVKLDLAMVPVRDGVTFAPGTLFFDFALADLRAESLPELDRITDLVRHDSTISLEIRGHTDSVGYDESNQVLSVNRASAVAKYMMARGIDASRLEVVGLGRKQPRTTNRTTYGRQLNRRVEFTIRRHD